MSEIEKIKLPILITRGATVFPKQEINLYAERNFSVTAINESINFYNSLIFVVSQKDLTLEKIGLISDIYTVGTLCRILYKVDQKDIIKVVLQGIDIYSYKNLTFEDGSFYIEGDLLKEEPSNQNAEVAYINKIIKYFDENNIEDFFGKQPKNFYATIKKGLNSADLSYLFSNELNIYIG